MCLSWPLLLLLLLLFTIEGVVGNVTLDRNTGRQVTPGPGSIRLKCDKVKHRALFGSIRSSQSLFDWSTFKNLLYSPLVTFLNLHCSWLPNLPKNLLSLLRAYKVPCLSKKLTRTFLCLLFLTWHILVAPPTTWKPGWHWYVVWHLFKENLIL